MQEYGGAETKYKGMSRIDVWNMDIKSVGIRKAPEAELNLMLMRSTRVQRSSATAYLLKYPAKRSGLWTMKTLTVTWARRSM